MLRKYWNRYASRHLVVWIFLQEKSLGLNGRVKKLEQIRLPVALEPVKINFQPGLVMPMILRFKK